MKKLLLASGVASGLLLMAGLGLCQSLEAQGKRKDAAEVKKEYEKAFAKADIKLKAPRF